MARRSFKAPRRNLGPAARGPSPPPFNPPKYGIELFRRTGENPSPPEVEQDTGTQTSPGVTSDTVTFANATVSRNGIVVTFALKNGRSVSTLTDNKGNTYNLVGAITDESDARVEMWYAQNITGGASHELTVTFDAAAYVVWGAMELGRVQNGGLLDAPTVRTQVRNNVGSSAEVSITSGRPRSTNELFVAALALSGGANDAGIVPATGWQELTLYNDFETIMAGSSVHKVQPTRSAMTMTWQTDTTDAPAASIIAAFRAQGTRDAAVAAPVNTAVPTISGTVQQGFTLTSSTGTWSNSPDSYTYQWYRDGAAITGATASTYLLTATDVGKVMKVTVTATNEGGSASASSANTIAVVIAAPVNSVLPVISGLEAENETLSTTNGTWSNTPTSYTYQWKRGGSNIVGATNSTYVLQNADVGSTITVAVTATNAGGSTTATSAATGTIIAAFTGILSGLSTASSGAWSTYRRLRTAYTGSLIRVRRSSDNTEQDIGYTAAGLLDTTALLAFAGAGSAFVKTMYDQSGNGRDATQTTDASQPTIVASGSLVTSINSKACASFDFANDFLVTAEDADNIIGTTQYCLFAIARPTNGAIQNDSAPYDSPAIAGGYPNGVWCFAGMSTNGTNHIQAYNYDGTHDVATRTLSYPSTHVFTQYRRSDTGFLHAHIDGGGAGGSIATGARTASVGNKFGIGRHYTGGVNNKYFNGAIMEVIAFATLPSLADRNTLGADQATIAGVTWTNIT